MALKRPDRMKYAMYTAEGKAKYAKDMRAYKKAQADAARKKATTKKPATKKPAAKKPAAKKPPVKKPAAKKPATTKTTTRPKKTANNLKIKKATNTAAKTTKQVIKKATPVVKKAASTVRKKAGEAKQAVGKKVNQVKKFVSKKSPVKKPTTTGQKLASGANQAVKKTVRGVGRNIKAAGLRIGRGLARDPKSLLKGAKGAGLSYLAEAGTKAAINRAFKPKGMTASEYDKKLQEMKGKRNIVRSVKNIASKIRGKSGESSTQTNINKQKKANTKPNRGLKIRRTERSSKVNRNKDYNAPTATKTADKRFSTFRVDSNEILKLQKERQKGNTETYSRKLSPQAKKQTTETKTNKKKTKKQSKFIKTASGSLARRGTVAARRAENREKARKRAQEMARRRLANR